MDIVIITETESTGEYNGDCDYAVIGIDDALRAEILRRRDLFLAAKAQDDSLYEMYFWGGDVRFYAYSDWVDEDLNGEPSWIEQMKDGHVVVDSFDYEGANAQRTECDQLVINEDGFYWTAIPRHTEIYVSSKRLKYEVLDAAPVHIEQKKKVGYMHVMKSDQGTHCYETALCNDCFTDENKGKVEKEAAMPHHAPDNAIPGSWAKACDEELSCNVCGANCVDPYKKP
jgi:hypothetical protein